MEETTKKQVLTFEEVKEILLLKDIRTIHSYVNKGLIPKIAVNESVMVIDQELLALEMNVEDFDEPFISHAKAAEIIGISRRSLDIRFCKKKGLSYYRLKNGIKQELLFRKSDIKKFLTPTLEGVPLNVRKIEQLIAQLEQVNFFKNVGEGLLYMSERDLEIFQMYLFGNDLEYIAKSVGLVKERVRQIVYKLIRRTFYSLRNIENWIEALKDAEYIDWNPKEFVAYVEKLQAENFNLKKHREQCTCKNQEIEIQKLSEEEIRRAKILEKSIQDLDLSVRAYNCLHAAEIKTFGELITYSTCDLLKIRNFGKKSILEIEELVDSFGFSMKEG